MHRPAFHYTPATGWMNDPNELVYADGKYHLFYQYYPQDIVWDPMHWGHAESADLLHWKRLPIALTPDSLGWIFSGSAVQDARNSAGFGKNALVAIFTYHNDELWKQGKKNTESQGLVYSTDGGRTWKKYDRNPVLNNSGEQDFRDPKVFWHDGKQRWNMVLAVGNVIKIFSSQNLTTWKHESDFAPDIKDFGVLECPDIFPMNVSNSQKHEEKWVMLISQNTNGPNGGNGTRYFVGEFDGTRFTNVAPQDAAQDWLDYGKDFYAAVTFGNFSEQKKGNGAKPIVLGWMSNWQYADKTPTSVWRSAMTLPRTMELIIEGNSYAIRQQPTERFQTLTKSAFAAKAATTPFRHSLTNVSQSDISFDLDTTRMNTGLTGEGLTIEVSNRVGEKVKVEIQNGQVRFDRSASGKINFSPDFADAPQTMPLRHRIYRVRMIFDCSSVEIFLNDGRYAMTNQYFSTTLFETITILSPALMRLANVHISTMQSVWGKK